MTLNNFLTTGFKLGMCIQFRDVVGNQTVDYTFRKKENKEFVEKLIWQGAKHDLQPVEQMELLEAVSEITNRIEKTKEKL